jgi:hypothetical protein
MMNRNMSQMLSNAMQQQAPMNARPGSNQRPGPTQYGMPMMGLNGPDPMQMRRNNNPQQAAQGFNNAHQQYMQNNQGGMFQHAFGPQRFQSPMGHMFNMMNNFRGQY